MSGLRNPKVRGRVWDPLVRLFHWSLAIAFLTAWFERSEAAIHETAGKIVLILIVIRTVWGVIGPFSARFETFIKGPAATSLYVWSILKGKPRHYLGHNPAGAAMIGALLPCLAVTSATGILMTTTAFWGNAWVEWIHGTAATLTVFLIAGHLAGVITASIQHRENLPLSMISGYKWVPAGVRPYLGPARMGPVRMASGLAVAVFAAVTWLGSESVFNASIWRMKKIVHAEVTRQGCGVSSVSGPRVEVYPSLRFHFDVGIVGRRQPEEMAISGNRALQKRPAIDFNAFASLCTPQAMKTNLLSINITGQAPAQVSMGEQ